MTGRIDVIAARIFPTSPRRKPGSRHTRTRDSMDSGLRRNDGDGTPAYGAAIDCRGGGTLRLRATAASPTDNGERGASKPRLGGLTVLV